MVTGTNLQLTYDENTDSWSYQNVDYEYPGTPGNSWSGFTSPDPDFEYVPETPDASQPDTDPCPAGYMYDETLKQCVPDPDYRAPSYYGEPETTGGGSDNFEDTNKIPSNQVKDFWISMKDKVIPAGQPGAGMTGLQAYIQNLDERGFTKVGNDGKLYFKKDNLGSALAGAALSRIGLGGEVDAKTNQIIKDLSMMGAINQANIVSTGVDAEGNLNLDLAGDLEISTQANAFPTYNYDGRQGDFLGVTDTSGVTAMPDYDIGGNIVLGSTWTNYINQLFSPTTTDTTTGFQTTGLMGSEKDQKDADDFVEDKIKEEKLKQEEIKTEKARQEFAEMQETKKGDTIVDKDTGDTYTKVTDNQTGGGGSQGFTFTTPDPKPVTPVNYEVGERKIPVGPRAGVMAPQPPQGPAGGPNLTNR